MTLHGRFGQVGHSDSPNVSSQPTIFNNVHPSPAVVKKYNGTQIPTPDSIEPTPSAGPSRPLAPHSGHLQPQGHHGTFQHTNRHSDTPARETSRFSQLRCQGNSHHLLAPAPLIHSQPHGSPQNAWFHQYESHPAQFNTVVHSAFQRLQNQTAGNDQRQSGPHANHFFMSGGAGLNHATIRDIAFRMDPLPNIDARTTEMWHKDVQGLWAKIIDFVNHAAAEPITEIVHRLRGAEVWNNLIMAYHPLNHDEATKYLEFHLADPAAKPSLVARLIVDFVVTLVWSPLGWRHFDHDSTRLLLSLTVMQHERTSELHSPPPFWVPHEKSQRITLTSVKNSATRFSSHGKPPMRSHQLDGGSSTVRHVPQPQNL